MSTNPPQIPLFINGQLVQSNTQEWRDIVNPATQEVLARVPFATADELNAAVASAAKAFTTWKKRRLVQERVSF